MKILLAWYPLDDVGGILNHNEQLCAGLQELGHEVTTLCFLPREDRPRNGMAGGRGTTSPYTGLEYDQRRGYSWPYDKCIPYRGRALTTAMAVIRQFDIVIWQVAVPTKRKENRGNTDWEILYQTGVTQLAVIHDGNFLASYPWLCDVQHFLTGLICVHHCAFNSAAYISVPSSFIPNPQHLPEKAPDISWTAWSKRRRGFLSLQTFKAWKHVPELVAAMPHVREGVVKALAGKGIDYYYLTSPDKNKWPGVWDRALRTGMDYLGVLTNDERDTILRNMTCLVDPSWSKKYSQIGGHFNRVIVDAIIQGALPVVRPLGISTNVEGRGELFVAGENCYAIPQHYSAVEYGYALSEACNLNYGSYRRIMSNAIELLPMFDRKWVAMQVLDLARGKSQQHGVTTPEVEQASDDAHYGFFKGEDDER